MFNDRILFQFGETSIPMVLILKTSSFYG